MKRTSLIQEIQLLRKASRKKELKTLEKRKQQTIQHLRPVIIQ